MSVTHTVRHRKDYKRDVRKDYKRDVAFLCTVINLDRHRLIMIIIAGRPASEFLGLHK